MTRICCWGGGPLAKVKAVRMGRESMNSDLDLLSHKELEVIQQSRDRWPDRQCSGAWSWLKVT